MLLSGFSDWAWGWGWAAFIGFVILLGIFVLPWFFFLLNLQNLLNRVSDHNRAMPAGQVWLNFIPIFNLGWFIYTVIRIRDSVRAEYGWRGWAPDGDFGYNVGLATGILAIVSFFIGWVPVLGWVLAIANLVCWILYWLKTSDLKNRLSQVRGGMGPMGPVPYGPYAGSPGPISTREPMDTTSMRSRTWPLAAGQGTQGSTVEPGGEESTGQQKDSSEARLCAGCGARFSPGDKFCHTCGMPLPPV